MIEDAVGKKLAIPALVESIKKYPVSDFANISKIHEWITTGITEDAFEFENLHIWLSYSKKDLAYYDEIVRAGDLEWALVQLKIQED